MKLSERIRQIRKSIGLDQAEFGRALGYSQGTVSRWEDRIRPTEPSGAVLIKLT
jgi:DNA-binding transcriptional regulator YiaG